MIGDSGDEEGEPSVRGEESVVDSVVVGEGSADSEISEELLFRCCWLGWVGTGPCRDREGCSRTAGLASMQAMSVSTSVTVSRSTMVSASRSNTDINVGI